MAWAGKGPPRPWRKAVSALLGETGRLRGANLAQTHGQQAYTCFWNPPTFLPLRGAHNV